MWTHYEPVPDLAKSRAGARVVDFPELIVPDVRKHLDWVPSSAALVFASSSGSPLAQLTANAGANLKELMARMGHDSERAALIYLNSTGERQRALADAVGKAARV